MAVYRVKFYRGKATVGEVNHSPARGADVKNEWSITCTPPTRLYKFTFILARKRLADLSKDGEVRIP